MINGRLTLIATRGLPASGKTTWALGQLAQHQHGELARCNRDDLRRMLHGEPRYDAASETIVTVVQQAVIRALLHARTSVIVDDTNLNLDRVSDLGFVAAQHCADFSVVDFTDVDIETCIERDSHRVGHCRVREQVIRDMHARYLAAGKTDTKVVHP
jgi:tRNA uridine 5-carbamoylmethylation protein Kti12